MFAVEIASSSSLVFCCLPLPVSGPCVMSPLDALPDISDVQVIVHTSWTGQPPDIIEDQVFSYTQVGLESHQVTGHS